MKQVSPLIVGAEQLARRAHQGQMRKDGVAYIAHPERVAHSLAAAGFDDLTIAAGWLHDTLEDTDTTKEEIEALNPSLIPIIQAVTEDASLPWVSRKVHFTDNLSGASDRAKAVACTDRIDNLTDFLALFKKEGPSIWDRWPERTPQEKLAADLYFLKMLKETWSHVLVDKLALLIDEEMKVVE
jgi:(p)ppGpp synthase/HD superfamily hydrolase